MDDEEEPDFSQWREGDVIAITNYYVDYTSDIYEVIITEIQKCEKHNYNITYWDVDLAISNMGTNRSLHCTYNKFKIRTKNISLNNRNKIQLWKELCKH